MGTREKQYKSSVYLDYQASTPLDSRVLTAMHPYLTTEFANPHASEHALGWEANKATDSAVQRVSSSIGCDEDEIIFTSGATESNNLAILGLARRAPATRRRVLVSSVEHACVLASSEALKSIGFTVDYIHVDKDGYVDMDALNDLIDDDVLLVSVMTVNNEIGTIQPIAEISKLARRFGAMMHTDAVHTLATQDIDVDSLDVDLLSLSSHKLYGPKGIGALYIRRDVQPCIEPLIYGGGQQNNLRSGTLPVPLCVGFSVAVEIMASDHQAQERNSVKSLRDLFVSKLTESEIGICLNGPPLNHRHPGNANLCFSGIDAKDLLARVQPDLAASTGSACTSGTEEPSHVLLATGMSRDEAESSIRFSIGRYTTVEEIDLAVGLILNAAKELHSSRLVA